MRKSRYTISSLTNPTNIANALTSMKNEKVNSTLVSNYVQHIIDSFLISMAKRYDVKGKTYFKYPNKYYYTDIGLRNARLNYRQYDPGHIMENIIYNELRYRGYRVDVGVVEIYGRDKETRKTTKKSYEVDFVATKGNQKYYIQSASSLASPEKKLQEEKSLRNIPDSFTKIIVVGGDKKPRRDENGFIMIGIKQFLLNEELMS